MRIKYLQMNQAYLILGSNLGEKKYLLQKAIERINSNVGEVSRKSLYYETEPWGFECNDSFINQVIEVNTAFPPEKLLEELLEIEKQLGRVRESEGYEPRTIDIDILFYNDEILSKPNLVIPHPRLHQRNFTLIPMAELNSEYIHPKLQKSIAELLCKSPDTSKVKPLN